MAPPLLQLRDIALTFGGTPLLTSADLSVSAGERVCLIGRNGSGKSTLLKIAAGLIEPDKGSVFTQPGASIRYLPQEPDLSDFQTTFAYVEAGLGPTDDAHRARYLLEQLGLRGDEEPAHLSGGETRRAALARALAPEPDILLLDEPTNHLDLPTIEWLEGELMQSRSASVLISHDRRFLENLTRTTVWLDRGRTRRLDLGFGAFETWRDQALAEEERDQHKLDRKIVAEEHWIRYGVTARRTRNERRVAELQALRQQRRAYKSVQGKAVISVSEAEKSGSLVIEAETIAKTFGERPVVRDFSTRIMRRDRIGVVGPNGGGKTTLVKLLTGVLAPDSGDVRIGANVQMAALEQDRDSLDPNSTLVDALTQGRGEQAMVAGRHVATYMKEFLFQPEQARTPLRNLSGGERARLMLARALAQPSNLLVLDEPTNDLDLETLDVLEELLADYAGTIVLISHDRDFLDRIVNAVFAPEGNGRWLEYAGGYNDMLAQRGGDFALRGVKPAKTEKSAAAAAPPRPAKEAKRRLSFHEKHALETLPAEMKKLQTNIASLQIILDDHTLYARDRAMFEKATAALSKAQTDLAAAEERWLELEILREEIDAQ
ncbi:ABC-F family ATP-binding cassette domain-containing protein [Terrarubrum flagellatum]|uniref:ABC-F family ATP-binding cassette domain-containing protein n=1 Tax=Terrirubrum flagellatum TaxID=2895980 RepID=UPI003144DF0F